MSPADSRQPEGGQFTGEGPIMARRLADTSGISSVGLAEKYNGHPQQNGFRAAFDYNQAPIQSFGIKVEAR
jgi:hypothetical protein